MAPPATIDRQTLLTRLHLSGLVEEPRLSELHLIQPRLTSGRAFARHLVEQGVLTRFQAERLLAGLTSGFVLDKYRILEQIGKGGMGRVYKAEHLAMQRLVALKVLTNKVLATGRAIELFLHEVRAAGVLQHPNIVTAYDANRVKDRYYLVMEFVDGPNLDQLVRQRGRLSIGLACDYIQQAAMGLSCAHQHGMLHRDIKPSNLLVQWHGLAGAESPGLVKISDFGLAQLGEPAEPTSGSNARTILNRDNTVMGTPDYVSPEQTRGLDRTDIRSDLYSLGCTFHFLLTGQVPLPGGTPLDKILRQSTETPRPVSAIRPEVPAEVDAIVTRLLAKDPSARFQTPLELADALRPFAVSGPMPWEQPRPSLDLEPVVAPVEDGPDELTELTGVDVPRPHDTPPDASPPLVRQQVRRQVQYPIELAIAVGVAVALGLVSLLALIGLLSRR